MSGDSAATPSVRDRLYDLLNSQFQNESDRACVILAAAMLDNALETLLKGRLAPSASGTDALFDGVNAPFSTFSARIDGCHRLALIDASFARGLHLVRRIRNDFAHNISGCDFADSAVLSRLVELRSAVDFAAVPQELRGTCPPGDRGDFQLIVSLMQWLLHTLVVEVRPVEGPAWPIDFRNFEKELDPPGSA